MHTPSPEPIKVLVVDDEALARQRLVDLLGKVANVAQVFEATDGNAAVQLIASRRPDVVFLDMQMPGQSGLDVVGALGGDHLPVNVFFTPLDHHGNSAIDAKALE